MRLIDLNMRGLSVIVYAVSRGKAARVRGEAQTDRARDRAAGRGARRRGRLPVCQPLAALPAVTVPPPPPPSPRVRPSRYALRQRHGNLNN